ncbi:BA14K family protein [Roseibium aestuarii]|uniref:Lectin-like protein BA14k n=1 Tax=Roseibium aestuarii TaxID=2600299 RepID=A0ABW4K2F5_9HYPH|nr:BA14K family protein [Roseibium aestuarii]
MRFHDFLMGGIAVVGIAISTLTGAKAAPLTVPAPLAIQTAAPEGTIVLARGDGFYQRGGHYWYNGHRGSRHRHPGWREYRGHYFPPAAFGLNLGNGVTVQVGPGYTAPRRYAPPAYARPGRLPGRHYGWCENRYRSYRASDNTFQPYHGPRRQCRSPYWG